VLGLMARCRARLKQLIAVSVAHITRPYCIQGHTKAATREGATPQEIMEAIWVAAKCAPAAHSPILALATLEDLNVSRKQSG
jgi:AhpD family alkylhydroperoxidase